MRKPEECQDIKLQITLIHGTWYKIKRDIQRKKKEVDQVLPNSRLVGTSSFFRTVVTPAWRLQDFMIVGCRSLSICDKEGALFEVGRGQELHLLDNDLVRPRAIPTVIPIDIITTDDIS